MNSLVTSIIASLWVLIGLSTALIMLEIQGNPKKREDLKSLTLFHRVLGFLFIFIFAMAGVFMIFRTAGYQQDLAPRPLIHAILALSLVPMILFKWLIARRFKRFFPYLPALGSLIVTTAFVLTALTAGAVFLYAHDIRYTTVSESDIYEAQLARDLTLKNCGKCHSLVRVLRSVKDREGWTKTVNRMAKKDIPNIRPFDMKQIIQYLLMREKLMVGETRGTAKPLTGENLVQTKCTTCHDLNRVNAARMDRVSWDKIIGKMINNAAEIGLIDFLNKEEKEKIIGFLSKKAES